MPIHSQLHLICTTLHNDQKSASSLKYSSIFNWNPRGRIQGNPSEESGAREITVEKLRKKRYD